MAFIMFLLSLATYVSSAPIAPAASVAPTSALPVANEDERVGWTSNPTGRGTSKIITSCTFTLALCIWTAIHPDLVRKTNPGKTTENENADSRESKPIASSPAATGTPRAPEGENTDTTLQIQTSSPAGAATVGVVDKGGNNVTTQNVDPTTPAGQKSKLQATENSARFRQKVYISFKALFMPEEVLTDARKQWIHAFQLYRALIAGHYILHETQDGPLKCCGGEKNPFRENCWRMKVTKLFYRLHEKFTNFRHGSSEDLEQRSSKDSENYHEYLELFFLPSEWELFGKEVAFFAVQGGFVREDGTLISPLDLYYAFMTDPKKVCDQIRVEDIRDKGNANVLTKLIVSCQCGWYVLNLILRLIAGIPIAFIELHVMIHIATTLVIYMFWWNKQLDVSEPIILDIPQLTYNKTWAKIPIEAVQPSGDSWMLPLNTVLAIPPKRNNDYWEEAIKQLKDLEVDCERLKGDPRLYKEPTMKEDGIFQRILSDWTSFIKPSAPGEKSPVPGGKTPTPNKKTPTPSEEPDSNTKEKRTMSLRLKGWAKYWAKNCAFYITYAGLHATVWRSTFPTKTEQWVWRVSCLTIAITPFLIALGNKILTKLNISAETSPLGRLLMDGFLLILYLGGAWTLLIESFLSLRNQPKGVYQTLDLSIYFPHL